VDRSEPEPIAVEAAAEAAAEDEGCAGCGEEPAPAVARRPARKRAEAPIAIVEKPSSGEDGGDMAENEAAPADNNIKPLQLVTARNDEGGTET